MRVAFKTFLAHFFDVLMLNTKFEIYQNMGSIEKPRISKATLDKKADSSLVSILKQSFTQLEIENKELKAQIKEQQKERNIVLRECVKLYKLVEQLREAIEEPRELEDK